MALSAKARRGLGVMVFLSLLGLAAALVLSALEDSVVYFYSPSQLAAKPHNQKIIRVGGLVEAGSIKQGEQSVQFTVSDGNASAVIVYDGILPDLFREGQGIIAEGRYDGNQLTANTVLAKHDERYMPKEVAAALKAQGVWQADTE